MAAEMTPCGAMFGALKKYGGIKHRELASFVLSGRPLSDGRSPVSRVGDRTWLSRFIVHAPAGSLQERYFCDYGVAALRVLARLRVRKGKGMTSEDVLDMVRGPAGAMMEAALSACHQDTRLYRNALERLAGDVSHTPDERAELALVLFVAAGCSGNVRRAVSYVMDYSQTEHGARLATPCASMLENAPAAGEVPPGRGEARALGLLRVADGYVTGAPHWVQPTGEAVEVGALVLGEHDIADVGPDVSGRHLRLWCAEDGRWLVEGLGSRGGTVLVGGADRARVVVEPPRADDEDELCATLPVQVRPGDELHLAESTVFMVIEGAPEAWG